MSIDEAINRFEKLASDYEFNLNMHKNHVMNLSVNDIERMQEYLEENRQLAEWLRELKEYRKNYTCFNCYNSSASFSDYPCCECRRCFKALDGIKDHYEEVNADETDN